MVAEYDYNLLKSHGEDVFISGRVEIRRPHLVSVGNHVAIDTGFYCTVAAAFGDYVHLGPYITVIGGANGQLSMGNFTTIGAGSRIICGSDEFHGEGLVGYNIPEQYRDRLVIAPVTLDNFVNIGSNVVVLPGVTLGEGSVVGSCSLVAGNTEPWTVYYGTPARGVKRREREKMIHAAKELGYRTEGG